LDYILATQPADPFVEFTRFLRGDKLIIPETSVAGGIQKKYDKLSFALMMC
jgi:hypothetical protein